jgi:hypothetical protein
MMAKSEIRLNFRKFSGLTIPWKIYRLGEGGKSGFLNKEFFGGKYRGMLD